MRLLLVTRCTLTAEVIDQMGATFDGVLHAQAPPGDLYELVARLPGMPCPRSDGMTVLSAELDAGHGTALAVRLDDLWERGCRLFLTGDATLPEGTDTRLRVSRSTDGAVVVLPVRVRRSRSGRAGHGVIAELEISRADADGQRRLEDILLWELPRSGADGRATISIRGAITELSDFSRLRARLPGEFDFDMGHVRGFSSAGVRSWIEFVRSIPAGTSYGFVRCSTVFVTQTAMLAGMLGEGRIQSFFAPYRCESCEREADRLFQIGLVCPTMLRMPVLLCPCGGPLTFDDVEERYLSFLREFDGAGLARGP